MYMQVIGVLVVILLLYYATMIALDIRKQKAARIAELENSPEVDIDISDEAETFKPVMITRDEPQKVSSAQPDNNTEAVSEQSSETIPDNGEDFSQEDAVFNDRSTSEQEPSFIEESSFMEEPFRRPGYREPVITDGVVVERLLETVNRIAETGESDLGNLIYRCESARNAS